MQREYGRPIMKENGEQRIEPFKAFRRTIGMMDNGKAGYVLDVDHIEYRFYGDDLEPVGVFECTMADYISPDPKIRKNFLDSIRNRYEEKGIQGRASRIVSARLGTKSYIVVYDGIASQFFVHDLSAGYDEWNYLDRNGMASFIKALKR